MEKKLVIMFVLMKYNQFYKYLFFKQAKSFVIWENSPAMYGWREIVFMKPDLYFFPKKLQTICIC